MQTLKTSLGTSLAYNQKNCIVATKEITGAEPGNITWITAVVKTHVTDCIWPDTPPAGVTLDEETYPDNKGNYLAVAKLVVDWDAGTASADPTFDQSSCGTAVSNFTSADVLAGLQTNAGAGVNGLPESAIQLLCGMTITSPLITQRLMQPSQGQRLLIAAFIQIILR